MAFVSQVYSSVLILNTAFKKWFQIFPDNFPTTRVCTLDVWYEINSTIVLSTHEKEKLLVITLASPEDQLHHIKVPDGAEPRRENGLCFL